MLKKIISGGQIGAERAALDAAIKLNIPHGGWTYEGRKTDDGPLLEKYKLQEISNTSFSKRIEKNILDSGGTVIFTHGKLTIGLKMTEALATTHKRPCLHIDLNETPLYVAASTIRAWMIKHGTEIVYFTGLKIGKDSHIYSEVVKIIEGIYRMDTAENHLQHR